VSQVVVKLSLSSEICRAVDKLHVVLGIGLIDLALSWHWIVVDHRVLFLGFVSQGSCFSKLLIVILLVSASDRLHVDCGSLELADSSIEVGNSLAHAS
jgi:hypothetical protein